MKIDIVSETISISINISSLSAVIQYTGFNSKALNDLRLILNTISNEVEIKSSYFSLPWHELKNHLVAISLIAKNNNIEVIFDELALKLVLEYLDDREKIKNPILTGEHFDFTKINLLTDFKRILKSEQIRDASILLRLKHGANFSVPGAGKTTTILAVHTALNQNKIVDKLFVICPINAFISWEDEIKNIYSSPKKIIRLTTDLINNIDALKNIDPDVILVNYEKLRRDSSQLISFFLLKKVHLVIDESHRIKSGTQNMSYTLISKLADLSKRRDILSGTPMPQSYLDLKPQFDLLWSSKSIIPDVNNIEESKRTHLINNSIKGLFVRTTKNELKLKEPNISYTYIKLGTLQAELYRLFKSEAARLISGMTRVDLQYFRNVGKNVVRLLQAATNPMLLGLTDDFYEENLPIPENSNIWELLGEFIKYEKPKKIEYLQNRVNEILNENPNNKVIIWSYFIRNIQLLEKIFTHFNPVSIYGAITTGSDEDETKREGRIKKFHEDQNCRIMIANPQACGEGISLHKVCHYAIYLDRNFNSAHFLQSIDRIHRLGLSPDIETNIEILVAQDTIDEVLIKRLNDKILAMGKILDDTYLKTLAYDPADIELTDTGIDINDLKEIKEHLLIS